MSLRLAPRVGAAVSTANDAIAAADEALDAALPALDGVTPDLGIVFVSPHHADAYARILERVAERAPIAAQLGCTGEGVLATGAEVEDEPGVAVWLAHLPGTDVVPFRLTFRIVGEDGVIDGMPELPTRSPVVVMLADPFTFPADAFVEHMNRASPGVPLVGGMASGGYEPGTTKLFFQGEVVDGGAIGVVLSGAVEISTVVSQGCRPIGPVLEATRADANLVAELDGAPAIARLEEIYARADERDRLLMRQGVHVGIAFDEDKEELGRGDFLIRNVVGADHEHGTIAVSEVVEQGSTVQFHVRDAASADEDLHLLLDAQRLLDQRPPAGALLFSCNGRGQRLFGRPHHDVGALARTFGKLPVAGFFAQGELGPVAGRNFLHGFTASIALFLPPTPPL